MGVIQTDIFVLLYNKPCLEALISSVCIPSISFRHSGGSKVSSGESGKLR